MKSREKWAAFILFLRLFLSDMVVNAIKINHLWVPDAIANGSQTSATLDCDYSLEERDKDSLEVKWYFRHDPRPIYQWVPPNPPQVFQGFAKHINLAYEATSDSLGKYRAINLLSLSTDLSGQYACRVSSNYQDDYQAKDLIIYVSPRILDSSIHWEQRNHLNITCWAEDAYPEPEISILLKDFRGNSYDITNEAMVTRSGLLKRNGLYTIRSSTIIRFPLKLTVLNQESDLVKQNIIVRPEDFKVVCQYWLPKTQFLRRMDRPIPLPTPNFYYDTSSQNGGLNLLSQGSCKLILLYLVPTWIRFLLL